MTTRDDLVSRLSVDFRMMRTYDDPNGPFVRYADHASALEAKDAEIATKDKVLAEQAQATYDWMKRAIAAESRITDLERQLAAETERWARAAESGRDHMLKTAQRDEVKHVKHAVDAANIAAGALNEIAAAIRGGAK